MTAPIRRDPFTNVHWPKRRAILLAGIASPALAWIDAAHAQSKPKPVLVGWLNTGPRGSARLLGTFKEELARLGWKEGVEVVFAERWADGVVDRLPALAAELAALSPKLIVAAPMSAVAAAVKATSNTPIVMASGGDPVATGYAKSLARPGGRVTGLTNVAVDLSEKLVELLRLASPKMGRIGFLADATIANRANVLEAARRSAAQYAVEARFAEVARAEEIEPALAGLAKEEVHALAVLPSGWLAVHRKQIAKVALERRWPLICIGRSWVDDGALLSYNAEASALYRRAASLADRILRGANPGDLPFEQPMHFEMGVNLKTAKALGLAMPPEIMVRATHVIQ